MECSIEGCEGEVEARGWCRKHYGRWYRHGDPTASDHRANRERGSCSLDGCGEGHYAKGLCRAHYDADRREPQELTQHECSECGTVFQGRRRSGGANVFCSRRCKGRYRGKTPEHRADMLRRYYERHYGLTVQEVEDMRSGGCGICERTEAPGRYKANLHIDHDHETGQVRGVLCNNCNSGLGQFYSNPDLLRKAIAYLES